MGTGIHARVQGRSRVHVTIGGEQYMLGGDGLLMPFRVGQPPPDLRHFNKK